MTTVRAAGIGRIACAASLLAIIAIYVLRNDSWIYSPVGWLDAWYYVGFGYEYPKPHFEEWNYKVSRLPWVLAQYSVRSAFDPLPAQYVLQLTSLLGSVLFFFFAFRRLLGEVPALIGAAFLATLTYFHASGGADYHDQMAGPLYAASFYCLTVAAERNRSDPLAFAYGVLIGTTIHSNILYMNLVPLVSLHYFATRRQHGHTLSFKEFRRFTYVGLVGVLATTVALGGINAAFGRDFLFFVDQFSLATAFVIDNSQQSAWWKPWSSGWYLGNASIGPLAAGLVASLLVMLAVTRIGLTPARRLQVMSLSGQYFFLIVLWTAWQSLGQTALQPDYFAYPLWFPLAGVIATAVGLREYRFSLRELAALSAITLIAYGLPFFAYDSLIGARNYLPQGAFFYTAGLYTATFLGCLALVVLVNRRTAVYIAVVLLGLTNTLGARNPDKYRTNFCTDARDAELAIVSVHRRLAAYDPEFSGRIFIVFDVNDPSSVSTCANSPARDFGFSLTSTGFKYLDQPWPEKAIHALGLEQLRSLIPRDPIIVLVSKRREAVIELQERFTEAGKTINIVEEIHVAEGVISVPIFVLK
jgi:dolichyl-phosphate-mannose-protein mannosyltransferase